MAFCVQSDLENALGGQGVLVQLADPNFTGTAIASLVTDYLESGSSEIRAAAEVKYDPETLANLDTSSLKRLASCNARLSARIAYERGGKGLAVPDWIADAARREDEFLDQLARGLRRLGRVSGGVQAAINQPAIGSIDFDSADQYSAANGGNTNPVTKTGSQPFTSGISIAGFRQNGFR